MDIIVEYIEPLIVFSFTSFLLFTFGKFSNISKSNAMAIYLWSTASCFVIIYFISLHGGDEPLYYQSSLAGKSIHGGALVFDLGSQFVTWFTRFFSYYLGLTYISTFLVFNFIGSVAYIMLADSLLQTGKHTGRKTRKLIWLIIFLPSFGIWTSSIGKDGFSLLSLALFLRATMGGTHRLGIAAIAILIMLLVRPHIAIVLASSLSVFYLVRSRTSIFNIVLLSGLIAAIITVLLPIVLQQLGLDDFSQQSINAYAEKQGDQAFNRDDAAFWYAQSLPTRILMTAFYPTILSASGILQLIVAIENIILTLLFLYLLRHSLLAFKFYKEDAYLWFYLLISWSTLGAMMYNTGLAARQKWMFIPILLVLVIRYMKRRNNSQALFRKPKRTSSFGR